MSNKLAQQSFNVPKDANGQLMWMFIDGEGKKDLQDEFKYTAQVRLTAEQAAPYIEEIDKFWADNRPAEWKATAKDVKQNSSLKAGGPKPAHSLGYLENDDGDFVFNFKTNPTYQDGTQKVIDIYNLKANKISLGGKKIGNGSVGALSGIMSIYKGGGNCGVTFYLNAVQLRKFVEFSTDAGFDAIDDEDGFEGIEGSVSEFENVEAAESDKKAAPRL